MVVICIILAVISVILYFSYGGSCDRRDFLENQLYEQLAIKKSIETSYEAVVKELTDVKDKLRKTVSQKKSSEVKTGLIVEQMAPFLEGFPYEPSKANFLAKPLDFVVFDDTGIHFVEVKSGGAQLSSKQRKIRDLIEDNKVTFEVYRIKGE